MKRIVKTLKTVAYIVVSVFLLLMLMTKWNFDNSSAFDIISTFLSISTGFSITALSIIATSSFSQKLYRIESIKDNSKTLLHILIGRFKTTTVIFILTIGLILIYRFSPENFDTILTICIYPISLSVILKSVIWYLTLISFASFFGLFNVFIKFILKSATNQE